MSHARSDLAVIIPTLNAAAGLAATLAALPPVAQKIVVDGGSTDSTVEVALASGAEVLRSAPGRGGQLAAGAAAARAPWLLFLHADTRLDPTAWRSLDAYLADPDHAHSAAAFRFKLDDPAWQARLLELGVRLRVAALALPYGDQGLLIHRDLYAAVGGYRPLPLMEDVDLVRRLGRRRLRRLTGHALTSAARWRKRGWARQSLLNLRCLALYLTGTPPTRIAQIYGR
ncbi:MAG: TIGR04283 family arsenosugar biosynthesis glycosyltransferase [Phenylobacterium sp.]|uniref:TIGR04283 family arsenosugar biosynthesis glycosyltransferase n=1 Tax=Phenylobacterium sp. TaxID=1871053 RepID=UPI002733290C|nr:TIGR04283 family arsenosugar biosynthesis glycosyltransferase [Phenylobacterium sp.]MDP1641734.1 TIGR04283 family arsenosugar biosynthesis glycosyltransferase [Phenylobacterium sp.]MDP3118386.1 TIGR04283 family arsenosugar biosynthesis glycosyltransferase [Phenylobacterium sp.]